MTLKSLHTLLMLTVMPLCAQPEAGPFTPGEAELICLRAKEQPVMRVLLDTDPDDNAFLRLRAAHIPAEATETEVFRLLCARMLATVQAPEYDGVGIAAPQVGVSRRVIAVQRLDLPDEPFEIYVNPEITYSAAPETGPEGCLSVPGRSGLVQRWREITLRYNDPETFEPREERIEGFTAVIFQHEIDHLDGILYTDKLVPEETAEEAAKEAGEETAKEIREEAGE